METIINDELNSKGCFIGLVDCHLVRIIQGRGTSSAPPKDMSPKDMSTLCVAGDNVATKDDV